MLLINVFLLLIALSKQINALIFDLYFDFEDGTHLQKHLGQKKQIGTADAVGCACREAGSANECKENSPCTKPCNSLCMGRPEIQVKLFIGTTLQQRFIM